MIFERCLLIMTEKRGVSSCNETGYINVDETNNMAKEVQ
jgi:hypothetical protein